jgi:hypothetical protein
VLETESGIASHLCVVPVRFAAGDTVLDSMVFIDWVSGTVVPGAGMLLCRRCMEVQKCSLLAVGGSSDALRVMSQARWFAPKAELKSYAKPLRPWHRFLRSERGGSKRRLSDLLKFLRNVLWSLFPSLPAPGSWTCRPARAADPVFTPAGDFVPIVRTRAWIDYLSGCPIANCSLWILENEGVPSGHALIANLGGSARVADFALRGEQTPTVSTQAFSALVRALKADNDIIELVAGSSLPQDVSAFQSCGLRYRKSSPVFLADPRKQFPQNAILEIKPMLNDGFYLYDAANPFQL